MWNIAVCFKKYLLYKLKKTYRSIVYKLKNTYCTNIKTPEQKDILKKTYSSNNIVKVSYRSTKYIKVSFCTTYTFFEICRSS